MANHKGSEGTVHVAGANAMAELTGWEFNESMNPIEDTILSEEVKTFQVGDTEWEGSADAFWDETDSAAQMALTIGASVALIFYPEGADTGDYKYSGTGLVTGIKRSAANNGMVEVSFTFKGNGALTGATV